MKKTRSFSLTAEANSFLSKTGNASNYMSKLVEYRQGHLFEAYLNLKEKDWTDKQIITVATAMSKLNRCPYEYNEDATGFLKCVSNNNIVKHFNLVDLVVIAEEIKFGNKFVNKLNHTKP